jgi:hypothetical protein
MLLLITRIIKSTRDKIRKLLNMDKILAGKFSLIKKAPVIGAFRFFKIYFLGWSLLFFSSDRSFFSSILVVIIHITTPKANNTNRDMFRAGPIIF